MRTKLIFFCSFGIISLISKFFCFQNDVTAVVEDFTASGASEISVRKSQQVEVIDLSPGQPNWCYVRTLPSETGEQFQGLVPTAILKPIPRLLGPGSRTSLEFEGQCKYILRSICKWMNLDD